MEHGISYFEIPWPPCLNIRARAGPVFNRLVWKPEGQLGSNEVLGDAPGLVSFRGGCNNVSDDLRRWLR